MTIRSRPATPESRDGWDRTFRPERGEADPFTDPAVNALPDPDCPHRRRVVRHEAGVLRTRCERCGMTWQAEDQ